MAGQYTLCLDSMWPGISTRRGPSLQWSRGVDSFHRVSEGKGTDIQRIISCSFLEAEQHEEGLVFSRKVNGNLCQTVSFTYG